jgi:hypothetical protein
MYLISPSKSLTQCGRLLPNIFRRRRRNVLITRNVHISIPNPLHILEQNSLTAAVIEFRGPAVGVAGDALSGFKGPVIFQKIRNASCRTVLKS